MVHLMLKMTKPRTLVVEAKDKKVIQFVELGDPYSDGRNQNFDGRRCCEKRKADFGSAQKLISMLIT